MRQIVLDTETTGLDPLEGHRVIEIGCVELVNRRLSGNNFHRYLNPERDVEQGAVEVHGLTTAFLADKPRFADIAAEFLDYVRGAELIIHNAAFDVGFLNHELTLLGEPGGRLEALCKVVDTLEMARRNHPGQRNSLDALCKRYKVDNSQRELHGALLDAEILADVYLAMTGGQAVLALGLGPEQTGERSAGVRRLDARRPALRVVRPTDAERLAHAHYLDMLDRSVGGSCLWRQLEPPEAQQDEAVGRSGRAPAG